MFVKLIIEGSVEGKNYRARQNGIYHKRAAKDEI